MKTNVFLLKNFLFWKLSIYRPRPTMGGPRLYQGGRAPMAPRWLRPCFIIFWYMHEVDEDVVIMYTLIKILFNVFESYES